MDRRSRSESQQMNIRNRVLATAGAAVLFASASLGAFAVAPGDTDAADVAIDVNPTGSGTLSVLVSETTAFNDVTFDLTTIQNSSGVLKVTATDDRGTALGWSVSIGATDFI